MLDFSSYHDNLFICDPYNEDKDLGPTVDAEKKQDKVEVPAIAVHTPAKKKSMFYSRKTTKLEIS